MNQMKNLVVDILVDALKKYNIPMSPEQVNKVLEIPPTPEMGDYSFPCFFLSEKLRMKPTEIAIELRRRIGNAPVLDFEEIITQGPYINFVFNRKEMARKVVWETITKRKEYGKVNIGKHKKFVVEFSSPNIAKPFGIGHLRSTIIGNSIANLAEFMGYKTVRINYLGDWGTQFGKLIYAYSKWGDEEKLHEDPINYLLKLYVRVNKDKKYEEPSREWFKKLEEGNINAMALWRAFREMSLEDFQKIYSQLKINFDEYSGESFEVKDAKNVVGELKSKNLLVKSEGALGVDLSKYGLGFCIIQKSDGSTIYATRDIAAAIKRAKKYNFETMIYEVGQEQRLHFSQVFKVLELMGYGWAKNCIHVYHGLYMGQDQKRLATRKGKTIFMKDIIDETKEHAKKEIEKRGAKISKKELEKRSHSLAIAAIFYGDLKNNRTNNMVFDSKKFVSFEGDTGPYLLYSYARATSIINKAGQERKFEITQLSDKEVELVKKLSLFTEIVHNAFVNLSPSIIAHYAYELAQIFNEFYHACPVIGSNEEAFRLTLVESFRVVLKNALGILGIETIEEM